MKKIGGTTTGIVIVEMTKEEWDRLSAGDEPAPNEPTTFLDEALAQRFHNYIQELPMSQKARNALCRQLGLNSETGWREAKFNRTGFTVHNRYVEPEEWARVVVASKWKDPDLLTLRNFGKFMLRELKAAIRSTMADT